MNGHLAHQDHDSDLDGKNDDLDIYPKLDLFDRPDSSSDDDGTKNPSNKHSKKLVIKVNFNFCLFFLITGKVKIG